MASVILIKDRENKPYALVEIGSEGTVFYPVVEAAKKWSTWMAEEFAGKKIKKDELVQTIDNSMSLETSVSESTVEELKNRSLNKPDGDTKYKNADLLPVVSVMDVQLSEFSVDLWRNAVQYKAVAFIADQTKSSMLYEVKRARGVWDPSLAVPGTQRRGGFRCPVGTRYGGQITDRFGRNCGWGVARRLANEISDLGERLENVGDARRERRVNRRNERVARRLAQGGAIERGARAVGDALDLTGMGGRQGGRRNRTGEVDAVKPGRVERAAGRIADIVNPDKPTRNRRAPARKPRPAAPQLGGMLDENGRVMPVGGERQPAARPRPAAPRRPRRNLRESEERRMEREIDNPGAPRTGDAPVAPANRPRPAAPRRPANPRPARPRNVPVDDTSKVPVPAGAPSARESLDAYKTRKYNEHQAEVRRIREQGGNAGFLRRSEWERYHGPVVEQAWRDRNPTAANAGRGRRRDATGQNAGRAATRRPRPAPAPAPARPRPARPAPADSLPTNEELRRISDTELEQRRQVAEEMIRAMDAAGLGSVAQRQPRERMQKILNEQRRRILSPARPAPAPAAPARPGPARRGLVRRAPARPAGVDDAIWNEYKDYWAASERMNQRALPFNRWAQAQRDLGRDISPPSRPAAPARPPVRPGRRRNPPVNAEFGQVLGADNGLNGHAPDRFDQKLGHKVVDGVLMPDHVAVGNAGINNAADAALHLRNGGSLDDVPDMLVRDAIFENGAMPGQPLGGKRFKLGGAANNGINNRGQREVKNKTYTVVDQITGKRYIMKTPSWVEDEIVGEQYAAMIGQLAGRPMARVRAISPREVRVNRERGERRNQNHAILVENFGDVLGIQVNEGLPFPPAPDRASKKYVKFIDAVMGNPDRHEANFMWAGNEQLPIDHGIVQGGGGIVPIRTPAAAAAIWTSVDSPQIKENFRNLSGAKIANMVAAQKDYWRSVGLPEAKVTQNARNMAETLNNLVEAARR